MIVKIVRKDVDAHYQCDRVRLERDKKTPHQLIVDMERDIGDGRSTGVVVSEKDSDVFLMNDNGETIESYRFKEGRKLGNDSTAGPQ